MIFAMAPLARLELEARADPEATLAMSSLNAAHLVS